MESNFLITSDYLKSEKAVEELQQWFVEHFPHGGEYQTVLDRCADDGRIDFGKWLLDKLGGTDELRVYDDSIDDATKTVLFAGNVIFSKFVKVDCIMVGGSICAGMYIGAGGDIFAGKYIQTGFCAGGRNGENYIASGGDIRASLGIQAQGCITSAGDITSGECIIGGNIRAFGKIFAKDYIRAAKMENGEEGNVKSDVSITAGLGIFADGKVYAPNLLKEGK